MMNKKNIAKIAMIFVVLISLSGIVSALGVAPAKKMVNFDPSLKKEIKLRILNNEHKDFKVVVYARGELAEYLNVDNTLSDLNATFLNWTTIYLY